jgi:hypothetical protein
MGRTSQKSEPPDKHDGKSNKPPPAPIEDDDIEDGDIATPKRDRSGSDDEPLQRLSHSIGPKLPPAGTFVFRFRPVLLPTPFARAAMQRHSWTNNRPVR